MGIAAEPFSLDRMVSAVEKVRQRLLRAAAALERAGVPYAVVGGNAVALWVSRVDEAAVRSTQDVDLLIRREDLERAKNALSSAGFVYRHVKSLDIFLDGPEAKPRDAIHLVFANERVRPQDAFVNPDIRESEQAEHFRVLSLEALVRIKLAVFRDKDRVHLRDLIEVGLVDSSWIHRFPPELSSRLKSLLDTPEG
jgi:hypothetical protein